MAIVYFDNAATSWPKSPAFHSALDEYFGEVGGVGESRSRNRCPSTDPPLVVLVDEIAELFTNLIETYSDNCSIDVRYSTDRTRA
jgi:hypothetical protein